MLINTHSIHGELPCAHVKAGTSLAGPSRTEHGTSNDTLEQTTPRPGATWLYCWKVSCAPVSSPSSDLLGSQSIKQPKLLAEEGVQAFSVTFRYGPHPWSLSKVVVFL